MYDYLVNHAIKNVWCAPDQDYQSIIQPAKVSGYGGTLNRINFQGRITTLPVQGTAMYVFSIGQIFSSRLGIQHRYFGWQSLDQICQNENLILDLYSESGLQFPKFRAYYYVTKDRTTMIALLPTSKIAIDFENDPIYLRFYRNAYYASPENNATQPYIQVIGGVPSNTQEISTLQNQYLALSALSGSVYAFVNGYRVQGIDLFTVNVNDVVEMVYDASIYKVVDFPIVDLEFFTSTLDNKYKYLLHYAGMGDGMIDYQDDIDIFLISTPNSNGQFKGVYLHKNPAAGDTLRNVTHKDYSIPTSYVQAFATAANLGNTENLVIRLHIRHSGMNRPLVYDANRIQELYKMQDADIVAAMIGLNATVPNWQAATLEAAGYPAIMRASIPQITNALVESAYGYNAIAKIIADTPSFTYQNSGVTLADIPYLVENDATVYEFDTNGLLLGWYNHTTGKVYTCANANCALVEIIAGQATQALDETYNITPQTLDSVADYRFYTCPYYNGVPDTTKWQDVTGSSKYYIANDIVTWLVDPTTTYTMVRGNTKFLAYDLNLTVTDGLLKFTLQSLMSIDFLINLYNMQIGMGELDLWLNGHALVYKVDYTMNFPEICITNKKFLQNPLTQTQKVTVRYTGFCQSDMSLKTVRDYGFVFYDRLSNNNIYDLRDDQVTQILVGGAMMDRSQLRFAEDDPGIVVPNAINGVPYEIRQIVVPLKGMIATDTYTSLAQAQVVNQAVSAYLTEKLPEVDPESTGSIEAKWRVVSPFVCKILYDMINGVLIPPQGVYSDTTVVQVCQPYLPLLAFDQTQTSNAVDSDFVGIDPHNLETVVDVSDVQYIFLSRVVNYYCNNLVNLSQFLTITT